MGDDEAAAAQPSPVFDTTVSYSARIWNYWLGGKDNYAADREAGDKVALMLPSIVPQARADRAFLGRAIRYLAGEAGLRPFLGLRTRLPPADKTPAAAPRGGAGIPAGCAAPHPPPPAPPPAPLNQPPHSG